jgi:transposase-like protein
MRKNGKKLRPRKVYSEEFKKSRVRDYESGELSVVQIVRLYGVSSPCIYNWIYRYSTYNQKGYKVVEEHKSGTNKVKELEKKVAELERALGQKQVRLEYYQQLIELGNREYGVDIEKNYGGRLLK